MRNTSNFFRNLMEKSAGLFDSTGDWFRDFSGPIIFIATVFIALTALAIVRFFYTRKKSKKLIKTKKEHEPVEEDKSKEKEKKKDEKPKEDHHHHHEPSWWTKFFARTIAVFCILYFFLIWVPEAKQALKDKYNSIMNSETSSSEEDPDGPLSVQYTPKEVVVTSSGFTKITSELRDFKLSISGSSWTVFVSNVDGSNEKSYDQDHLGDLKLNGPHRYRFVAKEGTVAVLKYTYVPHK